ncbi:MAG TPA: FAD-dependent oxidoreductase [Gammaproteobacteria bacterium]|nr:FAD-dependent oxidoreductase [Gammaproteobacteria bacterium]
MSIPAATDVLIVGAGPTGLTLACQLAARGVDFVLIDRAAAGTNESRAAVIHARTLEILEPLGVNDALRAAGLIVPGFTARDRGRVLITLQFDGLRTDYPYLLMIPQSATETVLGERLRALGGTVHRPAALTSIEHDDHTFIVGTTAPNAAPVFTRCRYVVGCDGMHSNVRGIAGIPFEGAAYPESFVLADVRMDWPLPADEGQLFLAPDGLMVIAPLPGWHHRIVATLEPAPEHPDAAVVQAMLDRRGPPGEAARIREVLWSSRFHVHHRMARHYGRGGIFLAGDAAHVHSPAGGQGMNTGIQDAQFLGARLADVLIDGAGEAVLDEYERVRRPVAMEVVKFTDRMTRFATAKAPWQRLLRNVVMRTAGGVPAVRRRLAMQLSELATR